MPILDNYSFNNFSEALDTLMQDCLKEWIDEEVELASKKIMLKLQDKFAGTAKVITTRLETSGDLQANLIIKITEKKEENES